MKNIILFSTHILNKGIIRQYKKLQSEIDSEDEAIILFDNQGKPLPAELSTLPHFTYDSNKIESFGFLTKTQTILPGNNHFPVIAYASTQKEYDYVWNIEYDVQFSGSWKTLFDEMAENDADFASCHLNTISPTQDDAGWKEVHYKEERRHQEKRIKSFNPIYRLSRKACSYLETKMREGWHGHHEVLIPTLLNEDGFSLCDMGGQGQYTPPELKDRFYCNSPQKITMRYRPLHWYAGPHRDKIYHPVKPLTLSVILERCGEIFREFRWRQKQGILRLILNLFKRVGESSAKAPFEIDQTGFTSFSIDPMVLTWCIKTFPAQSTLLELGGGLSTRELSKHFTVTTVEHDKEYTDRWSARYIHAPLIEGYYSTEKIEEALKTAYDVIIIDGPPGWDNNSRMGFHKFLNKIIGKPTIIVDDIHRFWDLLNFLLLWIKLRRRTEVMFTREKVVGIIHGSMS